MVRSYPGWGCVRRNLSEVESDGDPPPRVAPERNPWLIDETPPAYLDEQCRRGPRRLPEPPSLPFLLNRSLRGRAPEGFTQQFCDDYSKLLVGSCAIDLYDLLTLSKSACDPLICPQSFCNGAGGIGGETRQSCLALVGASLHCRNGSK